MIPRRMPRPEQLALVQHNTLFLGIPYGPERTQQLVNDHAHVVLEAELSRNGRNMLHDPKPFKQMSIAHAGSDDGQGFVVAEILDEPL